MQIFRIVLGSCNFNTDFFSTPRTTTSLPRTPTFRVFRLVTWVQLREMPMARQLTAQVPFLTASEAYSTWNRWPSGEKTVNARSYDPLMATGKKDYETPLRNARPQNRPDLITHIDWIIQLCSVCAWCKQFHIPDGSSYSRYAIPDTIDAVISNKHFESCHYHNYHANTITFIL